MSLGTAGDPYSSLLESIGRARRVEDQQGSRSARIGTRLRIDFRDRFQSIDVVGQKGPILGLIQSRSFQGTGEHGVEVRLR